MTKIDAEGILERLDDAERACVESLDSYSEIDSTSTRLMQGTPPARGQCRITVADSQTAGRGRRDKGWVSPPGAGLWLSLAYAFDELPQQLPALTLAIGVGIADALRELGADVWLKWPNDLIARGGKLGGILTEVQSQGHGMVVIGVGINCDLPDALRESIERDRRGEITDLASLDIVPPREELAATVVRSLIISVRRFAVQGMSEELLRSWQRYDWLAGKQVVVLQGGRRIAGTAQGVDADGALLLRTAGGILRIVSGSVELQGRAEACA